MASTPIAADDDKFRTMDRIKLFAATALTYGVGLAIVCFNPYISVTELGHPPLTFQNGAFEHSLVLTTLLQLIGKTPIECLTRIAIVALAVQGVNYLTMDAQAVDLERYRPYVFWRALYRFIAACGPFLDGENLDGPPKTSLTEYERITVRYMFVKLIFMPMMISFFFGTFQRLLNLLSAGPPLVYIPERILGMNVNLWSAPFIEHAYFVGFFAIMSIDIAWFALGCTIETSRWSPIKMVDPYASGWLVTLACYPPLVAIAGQYIVWGAPEFPVLNTPISALLYGSIAFFLYVVYVIADLSFGFKCGNLTYRGLVDKGPYKLVRHPMYAFKNVAWIIFTIPGLNIHIDYATISWLRAAVPYLSVNWGIVFPMCAWAGIYCLRGLTEERYLLAFPEYQEYCKRVKYRFIPWLV